MALMKSTKVKKSGKKVWIEHALDALSANRVEPEVQDALRLALQGQGLTKEIFLLDPTVACHALLLQGVPAGPAILFKESLVKGVERASQRLARPRSKAHQFHLTCRLSRRRLTNLKCRCSLPDSAVDLQARTSEADARARAAEESLAVAQRQLHATAAEAAAVRVRLAEAELVIGKLRTDCQEAREEILKEQGEVLQRAQMAAEARARAACLEHYLSKSQAEKKLATVALDAAEKRASHAEAALRGLEAECLQYQQALGRSRMHSLRETLQGGLGLWTCFPVGRTCGARASTCVETPPLGRAGQPLRR